MDFKNNRNDSLRIAARKSVAVISKEAGKVDWLVVAEYGIPIVVRAISPVAGAIADKYPFIAKVVPVALDKGVSFIRKGTKYMELADRILILVSAG